VNPRTIAKIDVQKLFGVFDHSISLQHESRLTIIHGPNGFGKTVMLGMIQGFASGDIDIFQRVPFDAFRIHFHDGTVLTIRPGTEPEPKRTRHGIRKLRQTHPNVIYELRKPGQAPETLSPPPQASETNSAQLSMLLTQIDRESVPAPFTLQGSKWVDTTTGTYYSLRELMDIFPSVRQHGFTQRALRIGASSDPEEIVAIRREMAPSFFIKTQRLSGTPQKISPYAHSEDTDNQLSVENYSAELKSLIQNALADYGKHSQQLDRSFPARLVQFFREDSRTLDEATILERLRDLDDRRANLMRIGFLEKEPNLSDLTQADVTKAPQALTIYVDDVAQKLSVFDDIEKRVTLFMDIINERFVHKRLGTSREDGFVVTSLTTRANNSARISLRDLSSGEQHELVVVFELLFKVKPGSLILIDEPEISLHVIWQSKFIDDLLKILEINGGFALVATHSPVIIGDRWDLTQQLQNPETLKGGREN
jgi:predicted ATP-binding protein involved in virulence